MNWPELSPCGIPGTELGISSPSFHLIILEKQILSFPFYTWASCLWQTVKQNDWSPVDYYSFHSKSVSLPTPCAFSEATQLPFQNPHPGPLHPHIFPGTEELKKVTDTFILLAVTWHVALVQSELGKDLPNSDILACVVQSWCQREAGHPSRLWSRLRDFERLAVSHIQDTWQHVNKPEFSKLTNDAPALPNKEWLNELERIQDCDHHFRITNSLPGKWKRFINSFFNWDQN